MVCLPYQADIYIYHGLINGIEYQQLVNYHKMMEINIGKISAFYFNHSLLQKEAINGEKNTGVDAEL